MVIEKVMLFCSAMFIDHCDRQIFSMPQKTIEVIMIAEDSLSINLTIMV